MNEPTTREALEAVAVCLTTAGFCPEYIADACNGDYLNVPLAPDTGVSVQIAGEYDEDLLATLDLEPGEVAYTVTHDVWDPAPEPGEHRLKAVVAGSAAAAAVVAAVVTQLQEELARQAEGEAAAYAE